MILVNGREIAEGAVLAETQYHPAASPEEAVAAAARALVVRELLLQRAELLGIAGARASVDAEERAIEAVLAADMRTPDPTPGECRRWYEAHRADYEAPALFEAAHILYLAPPDDAERRAEARRRARAALDRLKHDPGAFEAIARADSACASAGEGGRLGQVARGETCPEIETFLEALEEGQISPVPVETPYGVHVLRLDRRHPARPFSFEDAAETVANDLGAASWRRGVAQYIADLAAESEITGLTLPPRHDAAESEECP